MTSNGSSGANPRADAGAQGALPDTLVAAVIGGFNAMGLVRLFRDDCDVATIGVEAGGRGADQTVQRCASLTDGRPGVLHGNRPYLPRAENGQILEDHPVGAGARPPGVRLEHAWLHEIGRAKRVAITDPEAPEAFRVCCAEEGIMPRWSPPTRSRGRPKWRRTCPRTT